MYIHDKCMYIQLTYIYIYTYNYTYTSRRIRYRPMISVQNCVSPQWQCNFDVSNCLKKMIVCFLSNNPSSVLGSKRSHVRGLRFSHSVRRVFDVCLHISFPVCSHRHWKRRRHFHSCTCRRPLTLEDKLPGMDFLAPFQKQSMLPVWTLTHPRCFNFSWCRGFLCYGYTAA